MKLLLLLLAVSVCSIDCVLQPIPEELNLSPREEIVMNNMTKVLNQLVRDMDVPFFDDFMKSVDKRCMLNEYKKRSLFNQLLNKNAFNGKMAVVANAALFNTAAMCSNKTDAILTFMFENLMTFELLVRAFVDDPTYKEYADIVTCANSYAFEKRIINPRANNINHTLREGTVKICMTLIRRVDSLTERLKLQVPQYFKSECPVKLFGIAKRFIVKNILLVQVQLNQEQKLHERNNFIADARKIMEEIVECVHQEAKRE